MAIERGVVGGLVGFVGGYAIGVAVGVPALVAGSVISVQLIASQVFSSMIQAVAKNDLSLAGFLVAISISRVTVGAVTMAALLALGALDPLSKVLFLGVISVLVLTPMVMGVISALHSRKLPCEDALQQTEKDLFCYLAFHI